MAAFLIQNASTYSYRFVVVELITMMVSFLVGDVRRGVTHFLH